MGSEDRMNFTRAVLHRFDPEWIHEKAIEIGLLSERVPGITSLIKSFFSFTHPDLEIEVGNLKFPNPIGLAAGFDKDGAIVPTLQALGFGFVEVGTVTPKAQVGNPKPRLFRIKEKDAIINRMGFNNSGLDSLVKTLKRQNNSVPIGINIGKNKSTPNDKAVNDYLIGIEKAWQIADYFTINISSPNTKELRDLQDEKRLKPLINSILKLRNEKSQESGVYKQIWLKIAPDLGESELQKICNVCLETRVDALIISNTTIERNMLAQEWKSEAGGLSGRPLFELSNRALEQAYSIVQGKIPLIGVGGIFSAEDVLKKLSLGASLVQLYTSLVFEGPGVVKKLKRGLIDQKLKIENATA